MCASITTDPGSRDDDPERDQTHDPILIWGAGAIGGTVGAALLQNGVPVVFVDADAEHVAAIRAKGLRIDGPVATFEVKTDDAYTPATLQGTFRRVMLAVKSHHTQVAMRDVAKHLRPDGYVVSLQNGLCEAGIAEIIGKQRTIGAFVNFSADWIEPGHILYGGRGAFVVGELDGAPSERVADLVKTLALFDLGVQESGNIGGYLWGKLAYGSLLFVQALGEKGIADCLARPDLFELWRALAAEVLAVAKAAGVQPIGFNGFEPRCFMPPASVEDAQRSIDAMAAFSRPNAKTHSGIWRDLWVRKRATEVGTQVGSVIAVGRTHGLSCPLLTALRQQIEQCESGARPMSDDNPGELAALCGGANVVEVSHG